MAALRCCIQAADTVIRDGELYSTTYGGGPDCIMADHSQEECALHPKLDMQMQGMTGRPRAMEGCGKTVYWPGMRADARSRGVATSPMWGDHKEFQCQEGRGTMGQQRLSSRGAAVVNAITRFRFTFALMGLSPSLTPHLSPNIGPLYPSLR